MIEYNKVNNKVFARKRRTQSEDKMTSVILSFELHLKSAFDTTGILAILLLSFILLLAWKYRKSKQLIRYGRFKLFLQKDGRKPLPEENEECNCNQVLFS